MAQLK